MTSSAMASSIFPSVHAYPVGDRLGMKDDAWISFEIDDGLVYWFLITYDGKTSKPPNLHPSEQEVHSSSPEASSEASSPSSGEAGDILAFTMLFPLSLFPAGDVRAPVGPIDVVRQGCREAAVYLERSRCPPAPAERAAARRVRHGSSPGATSSAISSSPSLTTSWPRSSLPSRSGARGGLTLSSRTGPAAGFRFCSTPRPREAGPARTTSSPSRDAAEASNQGYYAYNQGPLAGEAPGQSARQGPIASGSSEAAQVQPMEVDDDLPTSVQVNIVKFQKGRKTGYTFLKDTHEGQLVTKIDDWDKKQAVGVGEVWFWKQDNTYWGYKPE
ncbi:hypothetical protein CPLU01_07199 [Colletotrichum plurivorum]|uniref:Uncharacterized protein n=1 Tax=Colletotrichum plurivorum TaxID=2175906 RepID=A0A8H6KFM6_9PEZI|nr:hypothetical protein CPLU01_07199 [Colletotrichum plurivorum]